MSTLTEDIRSLAIDLSHLVDIIKLGSTNDKAWVNAIHVAANKIEQYDREQVQALLLTAVLALARSKPPD